MLAKWFNSKNWGDKLNPIIIKCLSGIEPTRVNLFIPSYLNWRNLLNGFIKTEPKEIYLVIGSILKYADKDTIVWGAGFISENDRLREKPKKICAVRGPLTRKIVINQGLSCPKIYGDPALLYPLFYKPRIKKRYSLGIIPHYVDMDDALIATLKENKVLIIDIKGGINKVIDQICSCEKIASSSLHGLIAADAYKIPSLWIKFSDKILGEGFKFRDYFASVKRKDLNPMVITKETAIQTIYEKFYDYEIDIDLDRLLNTCPFKK